MRRIKIFDTTLRDGEQSPGCSMNLKEKLEVARQLERLKVDVIEAGFAIASKGDFAAVQAISKELKNVSVASLSRALVKDIDAAWEAVKDAVAPRIHTFIASSDIHMEYKLKMKPDDVIEQAREMVKYAKKYCSDVEFSAEDATRSRKEFLYILFTEVINAGANVINVPDTVGYATPEEMAGLIRDIRNNVPNIDKAEISVHCHNDLGMAVANSLAAARAGAVQLECTINGIGERAGNAALEEIVMNLTTKREVYELYTNVDTTQIYRSSRLVTKATGVRTQPNKAIVGDNAFAHEAGIHQHGVMANRLTYEIMTPESIGLTENKMILGKHSGRHAFEDRLKTLGYNFEGNELNELFEDFKRLADKKKLVEDRDIEALVYERGTKFEDTYRLSRFVINTGNTITTSSIIELLDSEGNKMEEVASGDGPVDASYNAIDKMVGNGFTLEDYVINAVTEGKDAQGEVKVRIKKNGRIYTGRGLSTDIIEASIRAYITAINMMIWQEKALKEVNDEGV